MRNKELKLSEELKKLGLYDSQIVDTIYLFEKYENKNLSIIEKLNRVRVLEQNRIKGGLKQTINAHGPIDKKLIGSATKRIYGALLGDGKSDKIDTFSFIFGLVVSLGAITIFKLIYLLFV